MGYDLEIGRAVKEIKRAKAKSVLIQLPEGLKPRAKEIYDRISRIADAYIFCGSCYGACDIARADVDIVIQWGHTR